VSSSVNLTLKNAVESISLTAGKNILVADMKDSTVVTARVLDYEGNPVRDGTEVNFMASMGTVPPSALTQGGVASVTFTASVQTEGTATVTATSYGVSASIDLSLKSEHAPLPPE